MLLYRKLLPAVCLLIVGVSAQDSSRAEVYPLPENGDSIIGEIRFIQARDEDTVLHISRKFGMGYREMQLANPYVDMWVPGEGQEIMLPSKYVLPVTPREGIVLNIPEMRLYYYPPTETGRPEKVITYPLGIGREGWSTPYVSTRIIQKKEQPYWHPPESIRKEHAEKGDPLPERVAPGPDNPLGDYAMRLGVPAYLIHGTNKPGGIGLRVSHGCIRLYPEDIEELFSMVNLDTPVHIVNQPYKLGTANGRLYLEAHPYLNEDGEDFQEDLTSVVRMLIEMTEERSYSVDWDLAREVVREARGVPVEVGRLQNSPLMAEQERDMKTDSGDAGLELRMDSGLQQVN